MDLVDCISYQYPHGVVCDAYGSPDELATIGIHVLDPGFTNFHCLGWSSQQCQNIYFRRYGFSAVRSSRVIVSMGKGSPRWKRWEETLFERYTFLGSSHPNHHPG